MQFYIVPPSLKFNNWHLKWNRKIILTVCDKQINFLLGKYNVWAHLEILHCIDSLEAILDSDACNINM